MTRATLADVLRPALREGYAVAGFVCQGWEDSRTFAAAAEAENAPVILQAGPNCLTHTPLPIIAAIFRRVADEASTPVALHLDHGESAEACRAALEEGFTSVMFDGSRLPLSENILRTAEVAEIAHEAGASCEGEIGFVGYRDGEESKCTDPEEARRFAEESGVDAVAVSIGNIHLQERPGSEIDEALLAEIGGAVDAPLVLHGGSGIALRDRARISRDTNVCKFNIGTEMRKLFGDALRGALFHDPNMYDRIELLVSAYGPVHASARRVIRTLRHGSIRPGHNA